VSSRIFAGRELREGELIPAHDGAAAVFSLRSPDKTTPNEDAAAVLAVGRDSTVLVVADGAGGLRSGAAASKLAIEHLSRSLRRAARSRRPVREGILDGIERGNLAVLALGIGAGSTIAAVELGPGYARPYHVGDSMILVIGRLGSVKHQTIAHSPVGYAMESGLLPEHEAIHHEERHYVSNFVGSRDMRIEIGPEVPLAPNDTVLIASDGVFDNLLLDEIVSIIRKGPVLEASTHLRDACAGRMGLPSPGKPHKPDDMTFIAYRRS